jgi:hypothetical protein
MRPLPGSFLMSAVTRKSGRRQDAPACPKVPEADMGLLFYYFVGAREHCGCNFEAERIGGFEIND